MQPQYSSTCKVASAHMHDDWLSPCLTGAQAQPGCLQVFAGDGRLLEDGDRLVLAHHLVQVLPANALR